MFADETNIFFEENDYTKHTNMANKELNNADPWLHANKLSLNINKTNCIIISTLNSKTA